MNRLAVLWLLVLTSGVLCDPGKDRGGPRGGPGGRGGKDGKGCMKKMMPPIQVSCDNNVVNTWVNSVFSDNTAWFEEAAKEKREGPDYYSSYSSLLAGLQNNICFIRQLAQRTSAPRYCSQYTPEQLMDCPDMDDMEDMKMKGKMMMMKKMKSKMCNMDVRKSICKLYQDKKKMKKIEEMIVWDYMMWTDCSDLNQNTIRADFTNFWANPSGWISAQMDAAPTLETMKMMKECFPKFAAENLGTLNLCSMVPTSERNTMQRKPSADQPWMSMDQVWSDKQALLDQASGDPKKYLCLVYYKVTADKSTVLGVDMDMGGYFWFNKAYKNVTKRIKSQLVWQRAQNPTTAARTKAQQILNGQWSSLTPPTWMTNGQTPTFQQWKDFVQETLMVAYSLYNGANTADPQYTTIVNNITRTLEAMFSSNSQYQYSSYMPRPDYKEVLMDIWKRNSDNPRLVPVLIRAKVDKLFELKRDTDQNKKYEKFAEKLKMYIKEKKMEAIMESPDCNSISNLIQYRTIAGYIVSRNWAQLEIAKQNWPRNVDPIKEKTIKACIINEVYNSLGSTQQCLRQTYNSRRIDLTNFMNQLEANTQISKKEKKMYIKSKMMQRRNGADGQAALCDLYFVVSASSSMDATEKKMHFGKMLWEVKKMLMKYDSLINQNTATCPEAAKRAVFEKASKMKGGMRDDDDEWDDDDDEWDDDDDEWDDDDDEEYDDEDEDDDEWDDDDEEEYDDDEWDDDDDEWEDDDDDRDGGRMGGRGRGPPGMMGMMKDKMMGMMKKKGGDKMKMCPALRNFKTCTDKLTCAFINEKHASAGCNGNNYTIMTQNVDRDWNAIQQKINSNTNFDFFGELKNLTKEIKKYNKDFAPCVFKYITQKLRDYWGMDECAIMQKVIKMKMMSKRDDWDRRPPFGRPPPPFSGPQRPMPPVGQPPRFQGNGQFMPQRPQPPFQQPQGRFSFNNWREHPQRGQWNRQR